MMNAAAKPCLNKPVTLLLLALAVAPSMSAQNEKITIEKATRGGKYPLGDRAFLYSKIDGEPYVLECELSHADCAELSPGEYEIARLIRGEGSYQNCPNVDIYRSGANRLKEKPLGEYCFDYMQDYSYKNLPVRTVQLTGKIMDAAGAGIRHATVILYEWSTEISPAGLQEVARFDTDVHGDFDGRVPLGKYDLFVLSSYTAPAARRITVTPQPQTINIRLPDDPDVAREACCDASVPTVDVTPER
jgi:hypothetical protein